jgi:hypothetical protein
VVVLRQLSQSAHNALWHLFSASPEQVAFAANAYRSRSEDTSTLLNQLLEGYKKEGLAMSYTMADFRRDYVKEHLKDLTPEERLEGLPPEERLKGLSAEEIERYLKRLKAKRSTRRRRSSSDENP